MADRILHIHCGYVFTTLGLEEQLRQMAGRTLSTRAIDSRDTSTEVMPSDSRYMRGISDLIDQTKVGEMIGSDNMLNY